MVKLNAKYLIRRNKANRHFLIRKKTDSDEEFLKRITHLPVQNQFIEHVLKIDNCINVKVLYLQNNLLTTIDNMENFPNLTHLYLQRNFLKKLDNLKPLKKLRKIYLGHNEIQVLEGMDNLKEIKEIHMENQDLPIGDTIYFEPMTMQSLSTTLQVLNISNNYLTTIRGLENLKNLMILNASNNYLMEIEEVTTVISGWPFLQDLNLTGNEVTQCKRYRDFIIYAAKSLEILDHVPIHSNTRIYVEKLIEQKKLILSKDLSKTDGDDKKGKSHNSRVIKFADDVASKDTFLVDFVDPFPPSRAIFLHPPWKLRVNVNPTSANKNLPRPYWRKGRFYEAKSKVSWTLPDQEHRECHTYTEEREVIN